MTPIDPTVPDAELDARYGRIIEQADAAAQAHVARTGSTGGPLSDLCFKVGFLAARLARAEARIARLKAAACD